MKELKNLGRVPAEMISIEQMPRSVWGRRRKRMLITHSIIYQYSYNHQWNASFCMVGQ